MTEEPRHLILQIVLYGLLLLALPLTVKDIVLTIMLWRRSSDQSMKAEILAFLALLLMAACFLTASLQFLSIDPDLRSWIIYVGLVAWLDGLGLFGWSLSRKLADLDDLDDVLARDQVDGC